MQSARDAKIIDKVKEHESGSAANEDAQVELSCKARKTVQEISRRAAAGRRVTALFSGPAGESKARTAERIARELDRELLHLRLSALAERGEQDVGENLEALLADVDADATVLLIDEAHLLFGRGELNTSSTPELEDQVLRCVDEYPGLAILAADHCRRIDPVLVRRLHYAVKI